MESAFVFEMEALLSESPVDFGWLPQLFESQVRLETKTEFHVNYNEEKEKGKKKQFIDREIITVVVSPTKSIQRHHVVVLKKSHSP